jgi:hypothetical protein
LADSFALVARLNVFFLAFAGGLTERVAGLTRRRLAYLALCAAAIFLFTAALIVSSFFGAAPDLFDSRIAELKKGDEKNYPRNVRAS